MKKLFSLFVALLATTSLWAHDFEVDGIYYNYLEDNNVRVTYKGSYYDSYSNEYSGEVTIPSTVTYNGTTYSVTSIGVSAFYNCSSLTSITIPNSVTSIGYGAFRECSSFTSVTIPNSVTSIGDRAFYNCESLTKTNYTGDIAGWCNIKFGDSYANPMDYSHNLYINDQEIKDLVIPNTVDSIHNYAFRECSSLASVTIGNSVTSIGNMAFQGCSSLTSITIPNSVTSIGEYAFCFCSSLTKTNYTGDIAGWCNIAFVDYYANPMYYSHNFYINDQEIKDLVIPNTVDSIHNYAFYGCNALTSITIPNSVTSIGERAFGGCSSLTSIVVESGNTTYDSRDNCNAIIETATNTLIAGCQNTVIPNSVTSIGNYAFRGCSSLISITIPNSVTSIGDRAFYYCSSLTSITIPNSVTSIGDWAFEDCSSLTSITCLGTTPPTLGTDVFNGTKLSAVYIPDNTLSAYQTAWGNEYVFVNNEITLTLHVATPGTLEDLIFDAGTRPALVAKLTLTGTLNDADFTCMRETMTSLVDVDLSGITNTSGVNFKNKTNLVRVVLPANLTSIGDEAFRDCSVLTSITIPNSVTSIEYAAFRNCSSLTSITIPNSVTSIGRYAFSNCSSLTSMVVEEGNTTYDSRDNCNAIIETATNTLIAGCQNTTIPNSVTSIGEYAFEYCSSLTSITIPNSVTSIGDCAFDCCFSLTSVTIGNSVTSIGHRAFFSCSSLTSVTIPNSVTSIGNSAFDCCRSLTSVTIGNSVTSIKDRAFKDTGIYNDNSNWENDVLYISNCLIRAKTNLSGTYTIKENTRLIASSAFSSCSSLTSITIPNSVTSIGEEAFRNCSSLTSVTIPNSVTNIGSAAFRRCSSLTSVTIPNSVTSIGGSAFYDCMFTSDKFINNSSCTSSNYWGATIIDAEEIGDLFIKDKVVIDCRSHVVSVIIPDSVIGIGNNAFYDCSSLKSIAIPNSVTNIGNYAFDGCSSLESIVIPNSVTSIGNYAFDGCSSLESIIIPENVTSIGDGAFRYCSSLTSITIPSRVTSIGKSAFYNCSSLASITIPNSVITMENWAFDGCKSISAILSYATKPPTLGTSVFKSVNKNIPLIVPENSIDLYKEAYGWSEFYNIKTVTVYLNANNNNWGKVHNNEDGTIEATPTFGCKFVKWLDGNTDNPRTIVPIQDTTFTAEFALIYSGQCGENLYWSYDNSKLNINGSGTMNHFESTDKPWLLFNDSIITIDISFGATTIGKNAFADQIKLNTVILPYTLEDIGDKAFDGCRRLYNIYCYSAIPPIAELTSFMNYNAQLYIPCEALELYKSDMVFGEFDNLHCINADTQPVAPDTIIVTPGTTDVTITWPTEDNAYQYVIEIKKDGEVFCTLTFNSEGQLLNIAFAPGRKGTHSAQYAAETTNGLRFTVTGLEEGTNYTYDVITKDKENNQLSAYSGEFTTYSNTPSDLENLDTQSPKTDCQKLLRDGQLLILKDNKVYTLMGQEIQ